MAVTTGILVRRRLRAEGERIGDGIRRVEASVFED